MITVLEDRTCAPDLGHVAEAWNVPLGPGRRGVFSTSAGALGPAGPRGCPLSRLELFRRNYVELCGSRVRGPARGEPSGSESRARAPSARSLSRSAALFAGTLSAICRSRSSAVSSSTGTGSPEDAGSRGRPASEAAPVSAGGRAPWSSHTRARGSLLCGPTGHANSLVVPTLGGLLGGIPANCRPT